MDFAPEVRRPSPVCKWDHSRKVIGDVLPDKYRDLMEAGWPLTTEEIERDAKQFLAENFQNDLTG